MAMTKNGTTYEPPKAKVYRFDDNDRILTASGSVDPTPPQILTADYAARALNDFMTGTNTTIEK